MPAASMTFCFSAAYIDGAMSLQLMILLAPLPMLLMLLSVAPAAQRQGPGQGRSLAVVGQRSAEATTSQQRCVVAAQTCCHCSWLF